MKSLVILAFLLDTLLLIVVSVIIKYRLIYEQESKERINNANICRSNKGVGLIKLLLQKQFLTFNSINLQTNIQRPFSNG